MRNLKKEKSTYREFQKISKEYEAVKSILKWSDEIKNYHGAR